jgi:hypothetical protein
MLPPLGDEMSIGTVLSFLRKKPWGLSTDFNASMGMMLKVLKEKYPMGTSRKQVLMVFTDMQFDSAAENGHLTNFQAMQKQFSDARVPLPTIVFWNIRGDSFADEILPVESSRGGAICLSGYSADLMQDFFNMMSEGVFCQSNKKGDVGEEPFVEKPKIERASTDDILNMLQNSPMYRMYK